MNIFVLDKNPKIAAEYHCNKHVVKMILESAQMLCAAHWYSLMTEGNKSLSDFGSTRKARDWALQNFSESKIPPYTFTHARHPCTVWTSDRIENYEWHLDLMRHLLDEYTVRYQKTHKSQKVWEWLKENFPLSMKRMGSISEHPQAMPDECKVSGDAVKAYRNYYKNYKNKIAKWEPKAKTPDWYKE